jgi:hypothetical protein
LPPPPRGGGLQVTPTAPREERPNPWCAPFCEAGRRRSSPIHGVPLFARQGDVGVAQGLHGDAVGGVAKARSVEVQHKVSAKGMAIPHHVSPIHAVGVHGEACREVRDAGAEVGS